MGRWLDTIMLDGIPVRLTTFTETFEMGTYFERKTPTVVTLGDVVFDGTIMGEQHRYLKDGSYFNLYSSSSSQGYQFHTSDGEVLISISTGYFYKSDVYLCVHVDDNLKEAQWGIYGIHSNIGNKYLLVCYVASYSQDARKALYNHIMNSTPPVYEYKPVNYITGFNSLLKLSMIKEESTNEGKDTEFEDPTVLQRLTDATHLNSILKSTSLNGLRRIGYTDSNNYICIHKTSVGETTDVGIIEYYIDRVHRPELDYEFAIYYGDDTSLQSDYYLSILVDTEKSVCRQSIIAIRPDGTGKYNVLENQRDMITEDYQTLMFEWLSTGWGLSEPEDPQELGGVSNTGGGGGSYNNIGDSIELPQKPSISAVDANFITVYNPTLEQIKSLAKYMWGDGFNIESFKKIFTNPMDCIIGLHIVPCAIPNNGVQQVQVGNLQAPVTMNLASEQFVDVDCGSIKVNEYWGSYLDYAPYTKISIYLPYIGTQTLATDDVMNKTISIKYRIDIITGACVCFIIIDGVVMYQYTGYCSASVPLSSQDYKSTISSIISIGTTAVGIGTAIATSGLSAPMMAVGLGSTANNVMNGKPNIAHGNSASGTGGFMSVQTPYITITRARQCLPKNQKSFTGYPSYTTKKLSTLTGFTQIEEIHLDNLSCTNSERSEIENLLKGGIIV